MLIMVEGKLWARYTNFQWSAYFYPNISES